VEGHAKLMDEYHANIKSPYYATVVQEKIQFEDKEAADPDWIVKQCYLLMIAAVTEPGIGVETLWKQGHSGGQHMHANFGQYVPIHWFKAFQNAAPYLFCHRRHWYDEKQDKGWEIFDASLRKFNGKRKKLIKTVLLLLDESMSGWRPKTTKTGGKPDLTLEPRKPCPLGTQLKNGVECLSGVLVFQDVMKCPELQRLKNYYYSDKDSRIPERTSLPRNEPMKAHVAEVLHQVEGAGVQPGGWVGGDAWFGSVMAAVELFVCCGVYCTFIIKSNLLYFPMQFIFSILKA
jgi:hypothetical protein